MVQLKAQLNVNNGNAHSIVFMSSKVKTLEIKVALSKNLKSLI